MFNNYAALRYSVNAFYLISLKALKVVIVYKCPFLLPLSLPFLIVINMNLKV